MTIDMTATAIDWNEASDWDGTACVVALSHDADPLRVGMLACRTESAAAGAPDETKLDVRKVWGRLFTLAEIWENQHDVPWDVPDAPPPPDGWWPTEGEPVWTVSDEPVDGFTPIWLISWA